MAIYIYKYIYVVTISFHAQNPAFTETQRVCEIVRKRTKLEKKKNGINMKRDTSARLNEYFFGAAERT